jgi:hypothetical protein
MPSAAWTLCVVALVLAGCGGDGDGDGDNAAKSSTPAPKATPGYPSSIAVLAHSGATGEDSDPRRPGEEVRANSWATGTNPEVKSLYSRILAQNPAIEGHAFNFAVGGATVDDLLSQAEEAVARKPKPELFVIQTIDADIVCPVAADELKRFRSTFIDVLDVLAKGALESQVFVVSQFGSPATYARALSSEQRASSGGTGPCDFINLEGRVVPKKVARLDKAIHAYEAQVGAACMRFRRCRYDEGAFGRIVDKPQYVASDLNHFSIEGHAKAAAVAWAAMKRASVVPSD